MNQLRVGRLLDELCVALGFCLRPNDKARLITSPPESIDAFTDAVFIAEELDPRADRRLWLMVQERVRKHFEAEESGDSV